MQPVLFFKEILATNYKILVHTGMQDRSISFSGKQTKSSDILWEMLFQILAWDP